MYRTAFELQLAAFRVTNGKAFPVKVDVSDAAEISGAFRETGRTWELLRMWLYIMASTPDREEVYKY